MEAPWPGSPGECGSGGFLERLAYGWVGGNLTLPAAWLELVGQEAGLGLSCGKLLLGVRPIL